MSQTEIEKVQCCRYCHHSKVGTFHPTKDNPDDLIILGMRRVKLVCQKRETGFNRVTGVRSYANCSSIRTEDTCPDFLRVDMIIEVKKRSMWGEVRDSILGLLRGQGR